MCELHDVLLKPLRDTQDIIALTSYPGSRQGGFLQSLGTHVQPATMIASPVQAAPQQSSALFHKKLWELDRAYHCSVIGTCLTLAELRQIQRRLGGVAQALDSDYDLHRAFVSAVREASPASRLIQKHLDRKYKPAMRQLSKARSALEFAAYWSAALASGEIAGAYWALITHPSIPDNLLDRIYGEVHMLSHLSGASVRVDMQELTRLRKHCPELAKQLNEVQTEARRRLAEQQKVIDALNQRLARALETERQLQATEARLKALEKQSPLAQLTNELTELKAQYAAEHIRTERAEAALDAWRQRATRSIQQNEWLAQQLAESRQERDLLEAALERGLTSSCANSDATNPVTRAHPDLVGRCVLYVGGRPSQCAHFRALVERRNGRFIYHDGGREDARAQLWDVVRQADAVFCPLDCVSHDAADRVKRFCERHTKPLVFLPRASLAAFNRGLNTVAS
ncbi:MAG TPA: DUF2325 domain-containing protein [Candidatus Competibacteraceae bacterium]|nr:DUF2325 domain-containing protein [Candidatus Competibacteraceae bacterium]